MLGTAAAAGAAALFSAGAAKAATTRPPDPMPMGASGAAKPSAGTLRAPVPPGVYAISKPRDQLLTLEAPEGPVIVLPPIGEPGVQEWSLRSLSNGNVTLQNLREGTYAGYEGAPQVNKPVVGRPTPTEWVLRQSAEPFAFHVVVPGGPIDGIELALDLSLLLIYPPRTALRPYRPEDQRQAWRFEFHE